MCIYNGWWLSHPVENKQMSVEIFPKHGRTCVYIVFIAYNVCPCTWYVANSQNDGFQNPVVSNKNQPFCGPAINAGA